MNKPLLSRKTKNHLYVLFFVAPSLLGVLGFVVLPTIASALLSLTDWDVISPPRYVGANNYVKLLLHDANFAVSWRATLYYVLLGVPGGIIASLSCALAVNQQRLRRLMPFFRTIYFLPVITSMVAVAEIFRWLYATDYGLINYGLMSIGLPQIRWLNDARWVIPALVLMSIWKGMGYGMLIYLAGLQSIPAHLYEAAQIDGADSWQRFWHITMPLLSPTHFFQLVTGVIGAFQVFDAVYLMTGGGPANASRVYAYYLFQQAFSYYHMGYASAMAWVLFVVIFAITLIQMRIIHQGVVYDLV